MSLELGKVTNDLFRFFFSLNLNGGCEIYTFQILHIIYLISGRGPTIENKMSNE